MPRTGEYLSVGQKIKEMRLNKGLSVHKTARRLHISGNYLSAIERGIYAPSDQVIFNLAEYFDADAEMIFKWYGKLKPPSNELLSKMPSLKKVITEISTDTRLNDDEKEHIINHLYDVVSNLNGGSWVWLHF